MMRTQLPLIERQEELVGAIHLSWFTGKWNRLRYG